ncbi:NYN domain-containing protein [Noviherbaspirillum sp. CPCC 100848]|uniref:NYN domain-containing protein n=1 Tax=Noviherbaspirillum album TaxID=3080276 RepID=A0ABU6JIL3_9BURK|nr:NYN domain-containing protein [Noviherbaspirillum sp. CPCC 100848]MEC4723499.1 NYN domain-containing protein [Noviherbaspirillum sp. CPCC 100848]
MASSQENISMALFCDFENVALGVRDAKYDKFDIKPVLERLLLKGSIVVKKAYCDWDRYKAFKAPMHEANFEMIEIPHVRQSGKNSADIRLVVDALDLCYTKSHVNTFVIISGDSDFSPLVSKLRENAKHVIGVGVKHSTSDLLIANCDEFIFYDDLVREIRRTEARRLPRESQPARRSPDEESRRREETETRKSQAIEMAVSTFDALVAERGDSGKIWASVLKEAIKRRKPDFSESYYGFRTFGNLLEEAQARGLLEFGRDEKSGAYVYRSIRATAAPDAVPMDQVPAAAVVETPAASEAPQYTAETEPVTEAAEPADAKRDKRRNGRGGARKTASARKGAVKPVVAEALAVAAADEKESPEVAQPEAAAADAVDSPPATPLDEPAAKPARKTPTRGRRPRKAEAETKSVEE